MTTSPPRPARPPATVRDRLRYGRCQSPLERGDPFLQLAVLPRQAHQLAPRGRQLGQERRHLLRHRGAAGGHDRGTDSPYLRRQGRHPRTSGKANAATTRKTIAQFAWPLVTRSPEASQRGRVSGVRIYSITTSKATSPASPASSTS